MSNTDFPASLLSKNLPGNLADETERERDLSRLVTKYVPLIRHIARRYHPFSADSMEDLIQVGSIGLLKAVKYYDPNRARSASFKTVATYYIRGEIQHYLRDQCFPVHVPRTLIEMKARIAQMEERLTKELARTPSAQELANASGCSLQDIIEAEQSLELQTYDDIFDSFDDPEEVAHCQSLSEILPDQKYQAWQHASEEREQIVQALKRLGEPMQVIVEFIYFYDLSQKETAAVLGLSEMNISRGLHRALKKLRYLLTTDRLS